MWPGGVDPANVVENSVLISKNLEKKKIEKLTSYTIYILTVRESTSSITHLDNIVELIFPDICYLQSNRANER